MTVLTLFSISAVFWYTYLEPISPIAPPLLQLLVIAFDVVPTPLKPFVLLSRFMILSNRDRMAAGYEDYKRKKLTNGSMNIPH